MGFLRAWFPDRLNIAIALLLLPFWLAVAVGFFSMFLGAHVRAHAGSHATGPR